MIVCSSALVHNFIKVIEVPRQLPGVRIFYDSKAWLHDDKALSHLKDLITCFASDFYKRDGEQLYWKGYSETNTAVPTVQLC